MERLVSRLKGEQAELGRQVMTFQAQEEQLRVELQARNGEKRALERRISVLEADLRSAREQADARVRAVQEELDRRNEIMVKQEILIEELRQQDQREGERRAEGEETQCQSVEMPSLGEFLERIHNLEATNRRLQVERKTLLEAAQSARILTERLHTAEVRLEQYQQRLESQTLVSSTPKPAPPIADTSAAEITNGHSTRQVRQLIERTAELAKVQEALGEAEAERKRLKAEMERLANQVGLLEKALKELQVENVNLRGQHLGCSSQENLLRSELSLLRERLEAAERTELATRNILMKIKVHPTSMEE